MKKIALTVVLAATTTLGACSNQYDHHHGNYGDNDNAGYSDGRMNGGEGHMNGMNGGECWKDAAAKYWFNKIDANHDGKVTRAEYMSFSKKMFEEADANRNGYLTEDELKAEDVAEWRRMKGAIGQTCHKGEDHGVWRNDGMNHDGMNSNGMGNNASGNYNTGTGGSYPTQGNNDSYRNMDRPDYNAAH